MEHSKEEIIKNHDFTNYEWIKGDCKLKLKHTDKLNTGKSFKVGDKILYEEKYFGEITLIVIDGSGDANVIVDYDCSTISDFEHVTKC